MVCLDSLLACLKKYDPDPKSGWDLEPDKLVCPMSCQKDVTNPSFSHAFWWFLFQIATNHRVVESVTGSVPVEHPH